MSVDFLGSECREAVRQDEVFGLCDDQENTKAYSNHENEQQWIAKVINPDQIDVVFTPIDNCIIVHKPGTKDKESTCDGMLTTTNTLYLVELKKQGTGGWLPAATDQLENTIILLKTNHEQDLKAFKYKKGFACNRKHPNFTLIDNELNKRFHKEYGFRVDAQREIEIKS